MKKLLLCFLIFILNLSNVFASEILISKIIDLDQPWGSSFINKDEIIITEKKGKIKIIDLKTNKVDTIEHNLNVLEDGQGGLLDILYYDKHVYVSYSEDRDKGKTSTSIAKSFLNKKKWNFKIYLELSHQLNLDTTLVQE